MAKKLSEGLLDKYINNTATPEERMWVETHYNHVLAREAAVPDKEMLDRASSHLRMEVQEQTKINLMGLSKRKTFSIWLRYAAAILVILSVGGALYWGSTSHPVLTEATTQQKYDIHPGSNRATLTTAGGETVQLSPTQNEIINGDALTYADGTSVLQKGSKNTGSSQLTLTTPKGGTYQVVLPDGTRVQLNAASILKYPSQFESNQRVVSLSGEAYFSVVKDPKRPFRVISNGQEVEVLGTKFNISAYDDEPIVKSTLIEGSVRVSFGTRSSPVVLRPGQQAVARQSSVDVRQVDVANAVAWKDGRISFEGKAFEQVMREIARWYDIEIRYEGDIPALEFYGGVFRNKNLSAVLQLLESAGLHYTIVNRTLFISAKPVKEKGGSR